MSFRSLSYGENYIRRNKTIHAEQDCINKLRNITTEGKSKKVHLLSLRVNVSGKLTMAKPCAHCIERMNASSRKGYKISAIYYSTTQGTIEKCTLGDLNKGDKHISSFYKR